MRRSLDIARSIRIAAASKGLYLMELADKIGLSRQQLHNILTNNDTSVRRIEELAKALGYDVFAFVNLANADIGKLLVEAENEPDPWEIPHWVNKSAWQDFEAHRKAIKKPLADRERRAGANLLKGLTDLEQQEVINISIISRWPGIYPEKARRNRETHKQNSATARNEAAVAKFAATLNENDGPVVEVYGEDIRASMD